MAQHGMALDFTSMAAYYMKYSVPDSGISMTLHT